MSDTYTHEVGLWDVAPSKWVTAEQPDEFDVVDAKIVGESGDEELVVEIERTAAAEVSES